MEFFPLFILPTSKIILPIHGYVKNDMRVADGSQFERYFTGKFENSGFSDETLYADGM